MSNKDIKLKILLIGKSGVGKSSIMWAFTLGHPDTSTSPTIGTDFQLKKIKMNDENVFLGIWDTAGLEMFKALTPHYYRDAHGAILVYDVTDPNSLTNLNGWIQDLQTYTTKENIVGLVLGNKIDQPRVVSTEDGENFAKRHRMMFMESSAKTLEGINEAFEELTRKILETPGLWEYDKSKSNIKLDPNAQNPQNYYCCNSLFFDHQMDQGESKTCGTILTYLSWVLVIITMPFSLFICFKVVQEYERAVIFRLGRLLSGGAKGPGIFFILPCIDAYARVDLRTRTYDVPPQEVLTKDSVTVSVDAVVYYRVSNATVSVANVENAHHSTRLLAQTTLRNTMGTRPLHEILSERETISGTMQMSLDEATEAWGIKVERVEIKDVRLPVQLQRAMAAEAEASREARAKVIAAEGEQKASRALREASEVMSDSPAALQLRYLQTLSSISAEKNSTIIFPVPIDFLSFFVKNEKTQHQQ